MQQEVLHLCHWWEVTSAKPRGQEWTWDTWRLPSASSWGDPVLSSHSRQHEEGLVPTCSSGGLLRERKQAKKSKTQPHGLIWEAPM